MRWSAQDLADFERRRSADGSVTSATVRRRKPTGNPRGGPSELAIHLAVAQHLRLRAVPGLVWFHPANGEHRDIRTAAKLKAMGVQRGVPDLILLHAGRTYALELKATNGRPSVEQKAVLAAFEAAGAVTAVAHGLDQALAFLAAWGLLRPATEQRAASEPQKEMA